MRRFIRAAQAALTFSSLTLVGCECADVNLGRDDAGRRDAGTFTPRTDACGNGIDDDRNGRIDDGCWCGTGEVQSCFSGPYPGHRVGACRDGTQTCVVQEFGDWGAFSCVGETLPSTELCDDVDNDCDGAVDEDCPCPAGTSRMCSDEFAIAPCMPGTQTCRAGTWSRCEGVIAPTSDVCGDGIDNDCDGIEDNGCTCQSIPEECGDGRDNDCDGVIDEPVCAPLPDAGMSLPDAGVDAPPSDAGACATHPIPRLTAPLSTSRVTSRRPTFRWVLPAGITQAYVEVCADVACTRVIETAEATTSFRPAASLPIGPVFWRVRSVDGSGRGCTTSHVWEIFVGHADTPIDTAQGTFLDVNRDGFPDFISRVIEAGGDRFSIHHGTGRTLNPTPVVLLPGAQGELSTAGDLNGDGFSEVLFSRPGSPSSCDVYLGSEGGVVLTPARNIANCSGRSEIGDFDGDGFADILVLSSSGGVFPSIYFGSADLMGPRVEMPAPPVVFTRVFRGAGDVNGDGLADVALAGNGKAHPAPWHFESRVYLGNPGRTWINNPAIARHLNMSMGADVGYFDGNGDGYSDEFSGFSTALAGSAIFGSTTGLTEASRMSFSLPDWNNTAMRRLGDVNGDGIEDAMRGLGPFPFPRASTPWRADAMPIGDVNGDGFDDAVVRATDGSLQIYQGSATGPVATTEMLPAGMPIRICN